MHFKEKTQDGGLDLPLEMCSCFVFLNTLSAINEADTLPFGLVNFVNILVDKTGEEWE